MGLPAWIKINDAPIDGFFRDAPDGYPYGEYSVSIQLVGELRFLVVRYQGKPLRWVMYNAIEDMDIGVYVRVTWDGMLTQPHRFGSQQGIQWVDEELLASIHEGVINPWDGWWQGTVEHGFPAIDVPNTATTGSPHTLHYDPHCVMMRTHGVSPMGARLLNAYLDYQLKRSRHRWHGANVAGSDGSAQKPIPGFAYGATNQHGMNPYDPGHMTVTRLTEGFALTGDPIYLIEALHAICHPLAHAPTLTNPWKAYNAREQAGWPIKAYADLVFAITNAGLLSAFQPLVRKLADLSDRAFIASLAQHPLLDQYAKPEIKVDGEKVIYCHAWHYAPVLFACELWRRLLTRSDVVEAVGDVLAYGLRTSSGSLSNHLADWFESLYDANSNQVKVHVAPSLVEMKPLDGVATWYAAGLGLSSGSTPLYQAILHALSHDYPESKGPGKHQYALNLMPHEFGCSREPYEVEA